MIDQVNWKWMVTTAVIVITIWLVIRSGRHGIPRYIGSGKLPIKTIITSISTFPDSWNWSGPPIPIVDQGSCNSCYVYSSAHALAARARVRVDADAMLKRQNYCSGLGDCDSGCDGGYIEHSYYYLKTEGVPLESGAGVLKASSIYSVTDPRASNSENIARIKAELQQLGPVTAGISQVARFRRHRGPEPFILHQGELNESHELGHALIITGWEGSNWIVCNSYGREWGSEGCGKIPMGTLNIEDQVLAGVPAR